MGNSHGKESRQDHLDPSGRRASVADPTSLAREQAGNRSSRSRSSRADLSFLGIGINSRERERQDVPFEHRETKAERETRKLEKERIVRAQERERSLREEHVDGGYLATLGTYTGPEDFSKPVVRQLQIERKMAPFWRGLNDWSSNWAEHQLIAAARGLEVPAADATPDPSLIPQPLQRPKSSSHTNLNNLTVPMGPRTLSAASDRSASGAGLVLTSSLSAAPARASSPFKPRAKALAAALSTGSRNASSSDLTPKEIMLPNDPFVNGQPMEVFLYKDADDCPICFLSYPPYLNHTRCCDQPICSECFVQIKRADPHLPEHHPDGEARDPNEGLSPDDSPEMLISEPSACPYCQQPEFGVTYEPPPFRRGLAYSLPAGNVAYSTAMSSQSSLNSTLSPNSAAPQPNRRRTHSLSANAPNVITTDRVRPDWATKLAAARAHQARRAAAATALHTAAFLMNGNEQRSSILRPGRFSRRNTGNSNNNGSGSSVRNQVVDEGVDGPEPGERGSSRNAFTSRRSRMDELEDMMFLEAVRLSLAAVRLSLAAEEERKRKEEKDLRKEAKKREKEERKAAKKSGNHPYGGDASGASGSSLSLRLGRRRGNSTVSNLRMETSAQDAPQSSAGADSSSHVGESDGTTGGKGKAVDRGQNQPLGESSTASASLPISTSRGGSHLRQMSNASSIGSTPADSPAGSFTGKGHGGMDPRSSELSMGDRSDTGDRSDRDGEGNGSEPMFNFRSLAEMVGVDIDNGARQREIDPTADGQSRPLSKVTEDEKEEAEAEHVERTLHINSGISTPRVMITPETPLPVDDVEAENKQLGHSRIMEQKSSVAR